MIYHLFLREGISTIIFHQGIHCFWAREMVQAALPEDTGPVPNTYMAVLNFL